MGFTTKMKDMILRYVLPMPFESDHSEYSIITPFNDEPVAAPQRLLDIAIEAIQRARHFDLSHLRRRVGKPHYIPDVWPGEHYKLLAGLAVVTKPSLTVEIGTGQGLSCLSMLKGAPSDSKIVTFDVVDWDQIEGTCLKSEDFYDGRLEHCLGDLADPDVFRAYKELLRDADIIFVDGPKNIVFETNFLKKVDELQFRTKPLFVFDDIRQWNMLKIWRDIKRPKLDLTSFGHWSGTGLVDWC